MIATILLAFNAPTDLDFWVGKWEMASHSRKSYGSAEFGDGTVHNVVKKVWGGKAIEESFDGKPYLGRSWSVFNPKWRSGTRPGSTTGAPICCSRAERSANGSFSR